MNKNVTTSTTYVVATILLAVGCSVRIVVSQKTDTDSGPVVPTAAATVPKADAVVGAAI